MNIAEKTARKLDRLQRRNPVTGFTVAVIKKYGEDQAGSQAALLSYYSFLSLFPILLILASLANLVPDSHAQFQQTAIDSLAAEYLQSTRNRGMVQCPSGVLAPLHFGMSCVSRKYGNEL